MDPEENLLCYVDSNKVYWYLKKNLGTLINDEPLVLRLNFIPKKSPWHNDLKTQE